MGAVFYSPSGKQLAAGERPRMSPGQLESDEVPAPHRGWDPKIDKPKRPCANCGARFQLTVKLRMLCRECFRRAPTEGNPFDPRDEGAANLAEVL